VESKTSLERKKIRLSRGVAVLSARKLKFWLQASFEATWNFEIPLKTQE
jgi:hypothetical protein